MPVDGHVHLHPRHPLPTLLDAAATHFERESPAAAGGDYGVLLLTEAEGAGTFDLLSGFARGGPPDADPWGLETTGEALSLIARAPGRLPLLIVRGRQIVTHERLEILALISDLSVPDGLPLDDVLGLVRESQGVPVLPWGFGKWWGSRGRRVVELLRREDPRSLFLGDNGGRPRLAAEPAVFRLGRRLGYRVLPGSDPLPLPGHERRPGSYGFVVDAALDPEEPAAALRRTLFAATELRAFGRRRRLLGFVRDQLAMQRRKRRRRQP